MTAYRQPNKIVGKLCNESPQPISPTTASAGVGELCIVPPQPIKEFLQDLQELSFFIHFRHMQPVVDKLQTLGDSVIMGRCSMLMVSKEERNVRNEVS